jgi:TolA-binding protein
VVSRAAVERPEARPAKALASDTSTHVAATPDPAHPSQAQFAASEQLARAPQVQSTLSEETRLLDAAFAALTAGERAQAGSLLREHERRFPAGLLQKERERAKTRLTEMSRGE